MTGLAWFTAVDCAEEVGIPVRRIRTIRETPCADCATVSILLDGGKEVQVVGSLARVQDMIARAGPSSRMTAD